VEERGASFVVRLGWEWGMLWGNEGVMKTTSRESWLDYKVSCYLAGFWDTTWRVM
jgi:hypothetical protein